MNNEPRKIDKIASISLMGQHFKNFPELVTRLKIKHGNFIQLPKLGYHYYMIHDSEAVRHMLLENANNYVKLDPFYTRLRLSLRRGLLTNVDAAWASQRKILQPYFLPKQNEKIFPLVLSETIQACEQWLQAADGLIELSQAMLSLVLSISCKGFFNVDPGNKSEHFIKHVAYCNHYTSNSFVVLPRWFPGFTTQRYQYSLRQIRNFSQWIIDQNLKQPHSNLLTILKDAKDPLTNKPLDTNFLVDEVLTLIVTGHETLGTCLAWTFYFIAKHPHVQQAIADEVKKVLGQRIPSITDLEGLTYIKNVIEESMRLYPPTWVNVRQAVEEDVACGYLIPAGANILASNYTLHRDPAYWEKPKQFIPERFNAENAKKINKYAYLPFGLGPRTCVARSLAIMQATVIIALVIQRNELSLKTTSPIQLAPAVTLKPKTEIWVQCNKRP